jgi:tRNA(adenine34) deaminase
MNSRSRALSHGTPASVSETDEYWMRYALALARRAQVLGEVPVGALVVQDNVVVGEGWNQPIATNDVTAHAEIVSLRAAGQRLNNYRLPETTLYVSLEPCLMCVGAMVHARIQRLVFGARDSRRAVAASALSMVQSFGQNHKIEVVGGVGEPQCAVTLRSFFRRRRMACRGT